MGRFERRGVDTRLQRTIHTYALLQGFENPYIHSLPGRQLQLLGGDTVGDGIDYYYPTFVVEGVRRVVGVRVLRTFRVVGPAAPVVVVVRDVGPQEIEQMFLLLIGRPCLFRDG